MKEKTYEKLFYALVGVIISLLVVTMPLVLDARSRLDNKDYQIDLLSANMTYSYDRGFDVGKASMQEAVENQTKIAETVFSAFQQYANSTPITLTPEWVIVGTYPSEEGLPKLSVTIYTNQTHNAAQIYFEDTKTFSHAVLLKKEG